MKLKKILQVVAATILTFSLVACGSSNAGNSEKKITIGATEFPHSLILEEVKPQLEEMGYKVEIKVFGEYFLPNKELADGGIDANFYQTVPYMETANKDNDWDLVSVIDVHIEPLRIYSYKLKSLEELPEGARVGIPNDPSNEGRALKLLAQQGLIKLNDAEVPGLKDITENSKKLEFSEVGAEVLPATLKDFDIAVINTNYAVEGKLNPNDSLAVEASENSPYINIVAVKEKNKDAQFVKDLKKVLNSESTKEFITKEFGEKGVVPAF